MENKKITLQELADVISTQSGTTKRYTDRFLRELLLVIQEYLEKDGVVKVKGLGTFKLLWIEARKSVNVATKESIVLPAHYKLSFTPEESVKQELNSIVEMSTNGAVLLKDADTEAAPIETEVSLENETSEIELPTSSQEEILPNENNNEENKKESDKKIEQATSKKSNNALISIIIVLVLVIIGLCSYIAYPYIVEKISDLLKPTLHPTKLEVVSSLNDSIETNPYKNDEVVDSLAVDSVIVDSVSVDVVEDSVSVDTMVVEVVKPELQITPENYKASMAMQAPTREVVTVIDGSRLTMVAYRAYGHKAFWVYVYDANRDKLKRPSDIEKGMQLRIADLPLSLVNAKSQICLDKAYELARKYDR